ncbi:MAG: hypothetical protein IPM74_19120 [Crocinitomicaceae bacterium]|nr:hypothetical protein [Crocinitomicaceae bacterium]MBK8927954.1 hypothetical protein [Crocinitomicaceae bacterium]
MVRKNILTEIAALERPLSAYDLYKMLSRDAYVLVYMGVFDDVLTSILMDLNDAGKFEMKSNRKKISFLIAECFQNIVRHANQESKDAVGYDIPEMFLLRNHNHVHHLVTTNIVRNADRDRLAKNIDHLKSLSKDELKELYLQVFTGTGHSEKGGAGLGLIEMARKSGTAPTYLFDSLGADLSNFFFQVNALPSNFAGPVTEKETSIAPAQKIYEILSRQKIVLLQKGDFTKESILPLIQLFENNLHLKAEDAVVMKKVITLLMEMLENINEHAKEMNGSREGVFYVAEKTPGKYEINTGNFIPVSQSIILKERLESIAKLTEGKGRRNYEKQLQKLSDGEKFKPGQGLIEICKNSTGKLAFDFRPIGHSLSYFSLKVQM